MLSAADDQTNTDKICRYPKKNPTQNPRMSDEAVRKSKRHSGPDMPLGLALDIDDDDGNSENIDLVAIERTWSKRLQHLEVRLSGYNAESIPSIPHEAPKSDPLARWCSETTADGFFHTIGEVQMLPERSNVHLDFMRHPQIHRHKLDVYGNEEDSDAGATCGLLSEISRGLSRL
ncbi:hypothetical protein TWF281_010920 [Arthrobotrys megalospora]